jgi:hypothetical protein
MPKITFTRDTLPHEGGPHVKGETLDCSDASAQRWINRNAAQIAKQTAPKPEAKAVDAPPKDKAVKLPPKKK